MIRVAGIARGLIARTGTPWPIIDSARYNENGEKQMILSVDPGLTGAICLFDPGNDLAPLIHVQDVPSEEKTYGKGKQVHAAYLHQVIIESKRISAVKAHNHLTAVVERTGNRPGEGTTSAFSSGFTLGVIHALLAAEKIPLHYVKASVWKRKLGLLKKDKDASRTLARELYPAAAPMLERKKDHNRAEAILIAHYGMISLGLT